LYLREENRSGGFIEGELTSRGDMRPRVDVYITISSAYTCVHFGKRVFAAALKRDIIGLSQATCLLQTIARGRGDRR